MNPEIKKRYIGLSEKSVERVVVDFLYHLSACGFVIADTEEREYSVSDSYILENYMGTFVD